MCVCGIFFPTHHEMWLGYYPSEFLSFVLLWVARDLFQYLRKHREKSLIYASVALLYAQIPPSNATWPLQRRQRRPTTLTVPLQHHLLMRDQLWTPLSKSRIWSSFCSSSCPVEATWLDVSSSYVAPDWWMWHCRGEASASRSFNVLLHIKQQCLGSRYSLSLHCNNHIYLLPSRAGTYWHVKATCINTSATKSQVQPNEIKIASPL